MNEMGGNKRKNSTFFIDACFVLSLCVSVHECFSY